MLTAESGWQRGCPQRAGRRPRRPHTWSVGRQRTTGRRRLVGRRSEDRRPRRGEEDPPVPPGLTDLSPTGGSRRQFIRSPPVGRSVDGSSNGLAPAPAPAGARPARASRRSLASVTTVAPSAEKTSVPPMTSASAVIRVPGGNCALEERPGERVLHQPLDRPLKRSGAVCEVGAFARNERPRRRREVDGQVVLRQPSLQVGQQEVHDRRQLRLGEGVEHDHLVDPVQELGPELEPQGVSDLAPSSARRRRGRSGRRTGR